MYYTASGITKPVGGRPVHKLRALNLASTCFGHYEFIIRRSKFYYTASGIITPVGGRPVHRLRALNLASTCFGHYEFIIRRSKLYYTASGIITLVGGHPVQGTATYRCDDARYCIIQF